MHLRIDKELGRHPTWPVLSTAAEQIALRLPNAARSVLPVAAVHGIESALRPQFVSSRAD